MRSTNTGRWRGNTCSADQTFASNLDGSFVSPSVCGRRVCRSHRRRTGRTVGLRRREERYGHSDRNKGPHARFPHRNLLRLQTTLAGAADRAGLSRRYYAGGIYLAAACGRPIKLTVRSFHGPDWKADVISPPAQFFDRHRQRRAGERDVDHAELCNLRSCRSAGIRTAPPWVASLVNAVGKSPYWKSTAIFIMWDDWGGLVRSESAAHLCRLRRLGFSRSASDRYTPYAKQSYVTHVQYETSSVVRYIEDNFGFRRWHPAIPAPTTRRPTPSITRRSRGPLKKSPEGKRRQLRFVFSTAPGTSKGEENGSRRRLKRKRRAKKAGWRYRHPA